MIDKTILVVDDEKRIRRMLIDFLQNKGYSVLEAENGEEALDIFFSNSQQIDLILLDVMMPLCDGFSVLKQIREFSEVAIIMLTAKSEEYDQLDYYSHGADDFIAKPFSNRLLLAHIEAILKRCYTIASSSVVAGSLQLDEEKREIYLEETKLELTPKEYDLIYYFMKNTSIALTRDAILNAIWGYDYDGDFRTVDTHVKQIRAKLADYSYYIKTIHGIGYRFEVDDV